MEDYIRLGLLAIAAIIIFLIGFDAMAKRRQRKRNNASHPQNNQEPTISHRYPNNLLTLMVHAKADSIFASYDLLQAISVTGMVYGEMRIFHYHLPAAHGRTKLFSLASATKPGDFDLNQIGSFACVGLVLFMKMDEVPDPQDAFDRMLTTAMQLAEDLDGDLLSDQRLPWNDAIREQYQDRIMQYQQTAEYA